MQLPTKEQALAGLFALWQPQAPLEYVGINDAYGRVLAKDLYSLLTLPQVRASAADGVCVGSAMFAHGFPDTTDWRYGVDYARADTGDDFDDAFDTVIRIEDVILTANKLTLSPDLVFTPGMNIRASGSLIKSGAPLLSADLPLRATDVAALAMGGQTSIPVYRRPRVAFIPTGNELIAAGKQPQRGENIDTNSIMAGLLLQEMGAEPLLYPIIPD
ncbi:MAG: molybdopterin molybdenumtransferase MoeA, partial [Clostridiales bacterium]